MMSLMLSRKIVIKFKVLSNEYFQNVIMILNHNSINN